MVLAARGARNLDAGEEPVPDAAEARQLRRQAFSVLLQALAFAAVLTALLLYNKPPVPSRSAGHGTLEQPGVPAGSR